MSANYLHVIRGFSALAVMAGHARSCILESWQPEFHSGWKVIYLLTTYGAEGLLVFFVLSGYLIGKSVFKSIENQKWCAQEYFLRRFTRLSVVAYPAMAVTLILGLSLRCLNESTIRSPFVEWNTDFRTILGNAFFLQHIVPAVPTVGNNSAFWSLSFEMWFYVGFPALLCAMGIIPTRTLGVRLMSGVTVFVIFAMVGFKYIGLLALWGFGAMASRFSGFNNRWSASALFGFWSTLLLSPLVKQLFKVHHFEYVPALALGTYLLLSTQPGRLSAGKTASMARWASEISYSLYAVHVPVVIFTTNLALEDGKLPPSIYSIFMLICIIFISVVFSVLFWRIFEAKTERVQSWIRARL